jgi:hypothetical protein
MLKSNCIAWSLLRLGMFVCVPAFAQLSAPPSPALTDVDTKEIIQRIEAGDVNALGVAALSGNQIFVPYLKEQLRDPKKKLHKETSLLQVGLAKAGQIQQLQQISCELNFGDASTRYNAMRKVQLVGGWFGISNMAEFLRDDPKYTKVFGEGLGPLQNYALNWFRPRPLFPHRRSD